MTTEHEETPDTFWTTYGAGFVAGFACAIIWALWLFVVKP
jgi:hypothetical protein